MINKYFKFMCLLCLVGGIVSVTATVTAAPAAAPVSYTADIATVFNNPERGFHNRYEIINDPSVSTYTNDSSGGCGGTLVLTDRTFACAKASGDTIIHSYLHLDKYTGTDTLPPALLDNLSSGLAAIRAAGLKIVLRPAYAWGSSPSVPEARILGHIAQINAVLSANADVVLHLEAGYLGPWGEWHTSLYTDLTNRSYADVRYRLVKKILDTTPATIPVAIRYPMVLKELLEMPVPSGSTALTQTDRDRLGHHNDCFLYNTSDRGTYDKSTWLGSFSNAQQKQYVFDMTTSYGGNKIMGGETCDGNGRNDSAAVTVQNEMAALNFTEINVDFWDGAINVWKAANLAASGNDPAETAFVRIQRKLGYRLRLVDATFPTAATAGGSFTFSANLNNDGYASVVKARPIFLVLESATNRYDLPLTGVDVRKWVSGANALAQQTVTLPANMPAGTYKLALWLPDNASGLQSRPEYSIRFANQGIWDAAKGYNVLANAITISSSGGDTPTRTNTPTAGTVTTTSTRTATPTPTATQFGGSLLSDDFNRANSATVGSGWTEAEASNATVSIAGNKLYFPQAGNVVRRPLVRHVFSPVSSGTLTWQYDFDWTRTGAENTYALYMQLGNSASLSDAAIDTGVGVNLVWTAVGGTQETLASRVGTTNTARATVRGAHTIKVVADVTSHTYSLWVDGTAAGSNIAFSSNVSLDTIRIFTDGVLEPNFGQRTFDNLTITGSGGGAINTPTPTLTPTATRTNTPTTTTCAAACTNTPTPTATMTPTATRTNTPGTPTVTSYEAESGSNTLAGGAVVAACSACSGGNKVGYVGNNAGTLQFNGVSAASAGSYQLTIYYLSAAVRSVQISVNGGTATTVSLPSTGSWTTVGSYQMTVSLNAGSNTIKLSNSSGWASDFDRMTVR